ncbi:MAG TPA: TraM recognition domain-containing protein [Solirubrobacteraceae bacterium]|jgi:type IV secretory pathway TraG/TraD family ATPase VirD4|nr:TraM recognition domain-containing protein [Solirubrobacteraceae bacterium]
MLSGLFGPLLLALPTGALTGLVLASAVRRRGLLWTWALLGLPAGWVIVHADRILGAECLAACCFAGFFGARWHRADLAEGADHAEAAAARLGIAAALRARQESRRTATEGWVGDGLLVVGRDAAGQPARVPVGYQSGVHALIVGATGSGKTVTEAWIAARLIEHGHGCVFIDPKGDPTLSTELQAAAQRAGRSVIEWSPAGPTAYNPYARGTHTEIADKALSGETFTEPHYLRQAQRYLGHTVRAMHTAGVTVTPASLMAHLDPRRLEQTSRQLPEQHAQELQRYLDCLTDRQTRDLAGVRDRLSILAESDARRWLEPSNGNQLDLHAAIRRRDIVYFRLDADCTPLLAGMLAAAIITDLISLAAIQQSDPIPTVVGIDEFSAVAPEHVTRLFARARSAGMSLLLATQELADLTATANPALRDQVLGNVETIIAHRQNVPDSAELISAVAGTKPTWITTQHTHDGLLKPPTTGQGTRRRGHEYVIHPGHIKRLSTGQAVLITPGHPQPPALIAIHHPHQA